jgi:hypothetical protein
MHQYQVFNLYVMSLQYHVLMVPLPTPPIYNIEVICIRVT